MIATVLALVLPTFANAAAESAKPAWGALAYSSASGALYKTDGVDLQRSDDGGKHWTKESPPSSAGGRIASLAVAAGADSVLYAGGPGLGIVKSGDGGKSWTPVDGGLPSRDVDVIATHSTVADTVYVSFPGGDIHRSEDGGTTWRKVGTAPEGGLHQLIHSSLEGSMQTGWLFAATDQGVYRSMDCFCGFRMAGKLPGASSAVTYDPRQPMQLYAAVGQQVFATANGGEAWQPAGSPGGTIAALAHSPTGVLYALLADGRVARSTDQGEQWE